MEDERLQRLHNSAAEGNVDALFSILEEDPYVLELINQIPFVTTPLHTAVSWGKIHFAKEIVNLKPSFLRKRDHLGRSPLHLALEGKHLQEGRSPRDLHLEEQYQKLVTCFIKCDPELVLVKAKGMVTPLHYAAEIDDESNLADFLYVCPSSIDDLTVKCETSVHVATKNGSCRALKVLLGCLRDFKKKEILNWEDEKGNNALHTATSENQTEVVKLLIKYMEVNKKNRQGLTALDIFYNRQDSLNAEIGEILLGSKAKIASEVAARPRLISRLTKPSVVENSPVQYFSGKLSCPKRFLINQGLGVPNINKLSSEVRNVLLVVAILITTATYQAALSPPGGYWQEDRNLPADNTFMNENTNSTSILLGKEPSQQRAGHMILGSFFHIFFLIFNSLAFFLSLSLIMILIAGLPFSKFILVPTSCIAISYIVAEINTFPYPYKSGLTLSFFFGMLLYLCLYLYGPYRSYVVEANKLIRCGREKKLRPGCFEHELSGNI